MTGDTDVKGEWNRNQMLRKNKQKHRNRMIQRLRPKINHDQDKLIKTPPSTQDDRRMRAYRYNKRMAEKYQ